MSMNAPALLTLSVLLFAGTALAQDATPKPSPTPAATPETPAKPAENDPSVTRDTKHYNVPTGKPAIDGYDPVAYFPEGGGKPAKGGKKFAFTFRGVLYHFASQANLDAFKKEPKKFEAAYGGWCANAMGKTGEKVEIDPTSFKITDGKLFLFYKDFFNDTRANWSKDEKSLHAKADTSWKKTSGEDPVKAPEPAETKPAPSPK